MTFYRFRPLSLDVPAAAASAATPSADGGGIFAANVEVLASGEAFRTAFRDGDNASVVATDSLKNFVQLQALAFTGTTLEGYLDFVARRLLVTYPQVESLRLRATTIPFEPVQARGDGVVDADRLLLRRDHAERAAAELDIERAGRDGLHVRAARSGLERLEVVKLHGNEFRGFVRDTYTTLPETTDRPLFIHLDVHWRYEDSAGGLGGAAGAYVPAESVRDVCLAVFAETHTRSIQDLVHRMGRRLLERFSRLAEVSFEAQNRTWDTVRRSEEDPDEAVFTDPRPPFGVIGLTLRRGGAEGAGTL